MHGKRHGLHCPAVSRLCQQGVPVQDQRNTYRLRWHWFPPEAAGMPRGDAVRVLRIVHAIVPDASSGELRRGLRAWMQMPTGDAVLGRCSRVVRSGTRLSSDW